MNSLRQAKKDTVKSKQLAWLHSDTYRSNKPIVLTSKWKFEFNEWSYINSEGHQEVYTPKIIKPWGLL